MTTHTAIHEMKPCRFYDASGDLYEGFTDGSRWNGFLNVAVSEDVFKRLWMAWYGDQIMRGTSAYDARDLDPNEVPTIETVHGTLRDLGNCYATVGEHDFEEGS